MIDSRKPRVYFGGIMDYYSVALVCFGAYLPVGLAVGIVVFLNNFGDIYNTPGLSWLTRTIETGKLILGSLFYGLLWPLTIWVIARRLK